MIKSLSRVTYKLCWGDFYLKLKIMPIKVKDYIKALQQCDPEAMMVKGSTNPELRGATVDAYGPTEYSAKKEMKSCTDMMYGGQFDTPVYQINHSETKKEEYPLKVVKM